MIGYPAPSTGGADAKGFITLVLAQAEWMALLRHMTPDEAAHALLQAERADIAAIHKFDGFELQWNEERRAWDCRLTFTNLMAGMTPRIKAILSAAGKLPDLPAAKE